MNPLADSVSIDCISPEYDLCPKSNIPNRLEFYVLKHKPVFSCSTCRADMLNYRRQFYASVLNPLR